MLRGVAVPTPQIGATRERGLYQRQRLAPELHRGLGFSMSPLVALVGCCGTILALFVLDRDRKTKGSWALVIPMVWLSIGGSRVVSEWVDPIGHNSASAYMEGNALDRSVQGALMALGAAVLWGRRRDVMAILGRNWPTMLFMGYCGVSTLWSDYPEVTFRRWTKAIGDLLMVLVVLTDRDRMAALKLPARVGFILIPASLLLIKYYPDLARGFDDITGEPTYTGVATSKNSLGMLCMVFGLGSVWRFLETCREDQQEGRRGRLVAHGAVIAMTLWLFQWAHSATSMSCLVFGVSLIITTGIPSIARRLPLVHVLVGAIVLVSFAVLFLGVGGGFLEIIGRDSSLTGRTDIWPLVLGLVQDPILGTGFESFWLGERLLRIWASYPGINQAHNGLIETYLNLGLVGVFLLAVVVLHGYRSIVAGFRHEPYADRLRLAYFVIAAVMNFTEATFKVMSPVWVLFLLAIMPAPRGWPAGASPGRTQLARRIHKWVPPRPRVVGNTTIGES
jgi:exopolysaccharide production protein ExoQ